MQAPMPDFTVAILVIAALCVTYAVVLGLAISRHRDQRSRNKEEEDKNAPN